jgi:hypothetical protein
LQEPSVVQEYLNDPYLLDGLKFDLRVYVLVTSADPLRIYIHKEGLVRFATENYEKIELTTDGKPNMQNVFVHLTNYALNKESETFRQAQDVTDQTSHKWTLTSLWKRFAKDGVDCKPIMSQIHDIVIKTLISVQQELAHNYRTVQPSDVE